MRIAVTNTSPAVPLEPRWRKVHCLQIVIATLSSSRRSRSTTRCPIETNERRTKPSVVSFDRQRNGIGRAERASGRTCLISGWFPWAAPAAGDGKPEHAGPLAWGRIWRDTPHASFFTLHASRGHRLEAAVVLSRRITSDENRATGDGRRNWAGIGGIRENRWSGGCVLRGRKGLLDESEDFFRFFVRQGLTFSDFRVEYQTSLVDRQR